MRKSKYLKYGILTALLLLLIPVMLAAGIFFLPAQYNDTFLGELKYKKELLEKTEGKRIVLVGGSSLVFGIDSQLLEENFPEYSVVNFGMYAGLGTTVMLDLSEPELHEGDIVIISPEQDEQTLSDYFNARYMWQAADGAGHLLLDLNRKEADAMIGAAPEFSVEKWKNVIQGEYPEGSSVYRRSVFNEYGDVESDECTSNIMTGGYDSSQMISFSESLIDSEFVDRVNAYTKNAKKKGAVIYYSFSPMNQAAVTEAENTEDYYLALAKALDCEIMGNPNDMIMDSEWFYDTNFHLNNAGKTVNTYQWIKDLKAMIGDSSSTDVELPEKPAMAMEAEYVGDDSDSTCFIWEENDSKTGIILTGLTDEGVKKQKLTVPTHIGGAYVTEISQECFAENNVIESITIQKNISTLQDHMFNGCSSLSSVILQGMTPQDCIIGRELLDGCEANIAVDNDQVSLFKTDYRWSQYSGRIEAIR